jgi:GNAT superfamily N-acetyltransferase
MIRDATKEDIPAMVALGRLMHKESIFAKYEFDEAKVAELMSTLICVDAGILIVFEEDYEIQGGIMASLHQQWFGSDIQATDYALFLAPEHRGNRTALQLIKAYVKQAQEKGAKQIILANSTGVKTERVAALFEKMGFVKRGYVFEWDDK